MSKLYLQDTSVSPIQNYFFDVEFEEDHDMENTITQNPVQSGAPVNDNVYWQPITITLDVAISDSMTVASYGGHGTKSQSAVYVLTNMWQGAHMLNVCTQLASFQNISSYKHMIIQSLKPKRDKTLMNAVRFTIVLQQVIITSVAITKLAVSGPSLASLPKVLVTPGGTSNLVIPPTEYMAITATYNGQTMSLAAYFSKYSLSRATVPKADILNTSPLVYKITPIIPDQVKNGTIFTVPQTQTIAAAFGFVNKPIQTNYVGFTSMFAK
jgi:hypothetical protein